MFGGALVTTANRTLFVFGEPLRNMRQVASVAAYLAPEVHAINRQLADGASGSVAFAALADRA